MSAHLILRCSAWPSSIIFEPQYQMEDSIEHWFGLIKSVKKTVRGGMTLANSIGAAHLQHVRQNRQPKEALFARNQRQPHRIQTIGSQTNTPTLKLILRAATRARKKEKLCWHKRK
jgi:hypothetical protein